MAQISINITAKADAAQKVLGEVNKEVDRLKTSLSSIADFGNVDKRITALNAGIKGLKDQLASLSAASKEALAAPAPSPTPIKAQAEALEQVAGAARKATEQVKQYTDQWGQAISAAQIAAHLSPQDVRTAKGREGLEQIADITGPEEQGTLRAAEEQGKRLYQLQEQQNTDITNLDVAGQEARKAARLDYIKWWDQTLKEQGAREYQLTEQQHNEKQAQEKEIWRKLEQTQRQALSDIERNRKGAIKGISSLFGDTEGLIGARLGEGFAGQAGQFQELKGMSAGITTLKNMSHEADILLEQLPRIQRTFNLPDEQVARYRATLETFRGFRDIGNQNATVLQKMHDRFLGFARETEKYATFQLRWFTSATLLFAIPTAIYGAIRALSTFDQATKNIQAVTGASAEEVNLLAAAAKNVALTTPISANEAIKMGQKLVQMGLSATDAARAMETVAKVTTVSGEDMDAVADAVATAMFAFNISAKEVDRVGNVLAATLNFSRLTIQDMGTAFNYVASTSAVFGKSLEETAASLAVLSNMGLKASTIGTGLSNLFTQLSDPPRKFRVEMERLNVSIDSLDPSTHSLTEILKALEAAGFDASKSMGLLGERAGRELAVALNAGSAAFAEMEGRIRNTQQLMDGFNKAMGGLTDQMTQLKNILEVLVIQIGTNMKFSLDLVIGAVKLLGQSLAASFSILQGVPAVLALIAVGITTLVAALSKAALASIPALIVGWKGLIIVLGATAVIGGVILLLEKLGIKIFDIKGQFDRLSEGSKAASSGVDRFGNALKNNLDIAQTFSAGFEGLAENLGKAFGKAAPALTGSLGRFYEDLKAIQKDLFGDKGLDVYADKQIQALARLNQMMDRLAKGRNRDFKLGLAELAGALTEEIDVNDLTERFDDAASRLSLAVRGALKTYSEGQKFDILAVLGEEWPEELKKIIQDIDKIGTGAGRAAEAVLKDLGNPVEDVVRQYDKYAKALSDMQKIIARGLPVDPEVKAQVMEAAGLFPAAVEKAISEATEKAKKPWNDFIRDLERSAKEAEIELIPDEGEQKIEKFRVKSEEEINKVLDTFKALKMADLKIFDEKKFLEENLGIAAAFKSIKAAVGAAASGQEIDLDAIIKLPDPDVMEKVLTIIEAMIKGGRAVKDEAEAIGMGLKKGGLELEMALAEENRDYEKQINLKKQILDLEAQIALLKLTPDQRAILQPLYELKLKSDTLKITREIRLNEIERMDVRLSNQIEAAKLRGDKQKELEMELELVGLERERAEKKRESVDPNLAEKERVLRHQLNLMEAVKRFLLKGIGITAGEDLIKSLQGMVLGFDAYQREAYERVRDTLKRTEDLAKITAESMRNTFSDVFFDAMRGELKSFQDYWSAFLAAIQRRLADTIADMIVSGAIFKSIMGILGAFGGGGGGEVFDPAFAQGGIARGGFLPVRAYAGGGVTDSPTLGLVGEGRYNEAIVPLPDGRSIPVQMKGNRGGSVVVVNNYQINAIDTKSWADHVRRNGGPILEVVNNDIRRNGATRTMIRTRT